MIDRSCKKAGMNEIRTQGLHKLMPCDHLLVVGFIAQLVEHCTGIAEVMGSNPVQVCFFFQA